MGVEDFQERLERLGAGETQRPAPARKPASGGLGHLIFGAVWGAIVGAIIFFVGGNYDALVSEPGIENLPAWLNMALGFFLLSIAIVALMLVSGLLMLLVGKGSPRRWRVLGGFAIGLAVSGVAGRFV